MNEKNKERFCELLRTINRDGADIEGLIQKLESTDFFTCPASTQYHGSFAGGLLQHSLNVYDNLKTITNAKREFLPELDEDSITILGLLHDMSKMNLYEKHIKNEKVYSPAGSKQDNLGRFDWISSEKYKVKDAKDRFIYGSHEETSEFMVRTFIPLAVEESVAILNHHNSLSYDSKKCTPNDLYDRYPLAALLHIADMLATYVDENIEIEIDE